MKKSEMVILCVALICAMIVSMASIGIRKQPTSVDNMVEPGRLGVPIVAGQLWKHTGPEGRACWITAVTEDVVEWKSLRCMEYNGEEYAGRSKKTVFWETHGLIYWPDGEPKPEDTSLIGPYFLPSRGDEGQPHP